MTSTTESPTSTTPDEQHWRIRPRTVLAAIAVVLVVLAGALTAGMAAVTVVVHGHSMLPTLHDGDRLFVTPGTGGAVNRFDVDVMKQPGNNVLIVKRIIGMPGDGIEIVDDHGGHDVYVRPNNRGQWFKVMQAAWDGQDTIQSSCCEVDGRAGNKPTMQVVPQGKVFVLGDNPDGSEDSRKFGWVSISSIKGQAGFRVWPHPGTVPNRPYLMPAEPPK